MPEHVEAELHRIRERLASYPDPFEHAGLYAAQQALSWAWQPEAFASPYSIIVRDIPEGSEDCPGFLRPPASYPDCN